MTSQTPSAVLLRALDFVSLLQQNKTDLVTFDIGAGEGRNTRYLANSGLFSEVHACDFGLTEERFFTSLGPIISTTSVLYRQVSTGDLFFFNGSNTGMYSLFNLVRLIQYIPKDNLYYLFHKLYVGGCDDAVMAISYTMDVGILDNPELVSYKHLT